MFSSKAITCAKALRPSARTLHCSRSMHKGGHLLAMPLIFGAGFGVSSMNNSRKMHNVEIGFTKERESFEEKLSHQSKEKDSIFRELEEIKAKATEATEAQTLKLEQMELEKANYFENSNSTIVSKFDKHFLKDQIKGLKSSDEDHMLIIFGEREEGISEYIHKAVKKFKLVLNAEETKHGWTYSTSSGNLDDVSIIEKTKQLKNLALILGEVLIVTIDRVGECEDDARIHALTEEFNLLADKDCKVIINMMDKNIDFLESMSRVNIRLAEEPKKDEKKDKDKKKKDKYKEKGKEKKKEKNDKKKEKKDKYKKKGDKHKEDKKDKKKKKEKHKDKAPKKDKHKSKKDKHKKGKKDKKSKKEKE